MDNRKKKKPVYLITPTGDRPECFKFLTKYVLEQTYRDPIVWVVVDDGEVPLEMPAALPSHIALDVVRPKNSIPRAGQNRFERRASFPLGEGRRGETILQSLRCLEHVNPDGARPNTQAANMISGLQRVQDDAAVLIFEDDDIYLPGHIANVVAALEVYDLVGERVSRYYNVATERYAETPGMWHAAMCSTAVKGPALEVLYETCAMHLSFLDFHLWNSYKGPKKLLDTNNVIGIKGMPGRRGIGAGHQSSSGNPGPDVLSSWVGPKIAAQYENYRCSRPPVNAGFPR